MTLKSNFQGLNFKSDMKWSQIKILEVRLSEVNNLINKKANWIIEKLREVQGIPVPRQREYVSGESFPLLGKEYRLKVVKGKVGKARQEGSSIVVSDPENTSFSTQSQITKLYKEIAEEKLRAKVSFFANKLGVEPKEVKICDFKSQWGSCTPSGVISLNWQIITAPSSIVDYVVVHELCHLEHPNHSKGFWKLIESVLPNYKPISASLKHYKNLIQVFDR